MIRQFDASEHQILRTCDFCARLAARHPGRRRLRSSAQRRRSCCSSPASRSPPTTSSSAMQADRARGGKPDRRQEVIDELIDDKLKILAAKRFNFEMTPGRGRQRLRQHGAQCGMYARSVQRACSKAPASMPNTLKARLKADMTWNQMVRGRFVQLAPGRREGHLRGGAAAQRAEGGRLSITRCTRSPSWFRAVRPPASSRRASARPTRCARASRTATTACLRPRAPGGRGAAPIRRNSRGSQSGNCARCWPRWRSAR